MIAAAKPPAGFGPSLAVAAATMLIGALSAAASGSPVAVAIGAVVGLGWALLLGRIARALSQRADWGHRAADWSASLGVLAASTLFGGSLFAILLMVPALPTPELLLTVLRPPMAGGFTFFVILNPLVEWVAIPAALYLNWHIPRRRTLLLAGALLYYAARAWTYLYFVPAIFEFMATPPGAALSAELVARVTRWVNLSVVRMAIDGLLALAFLLAAARRAGAPDR
jgi:hypothetical protein